MIESPSKSQGIPQGERWLPIQKYALAMSGDAQWQPAGAGIEQRDLGLGRASEGAMRARQLRAAGGDAILTQAPDAEGAHFHLFYVIKGRV
ncbi:MAG: hypothetical protein Q7U75_12765, partial [Desulfobacterales bacterium]|nr:hypothetical protein [Desulfobacterales bacterium]